ncbi:cation:proton antiporter [Candidatus Micrarchaeota archaeon]|nr:cation:proton antiporter [Candidatus Micrarchaeota archaeon]
MEDLAISDFGLVLLFAVLAGVLSVRLKLPPVAGLLFTGMLLGPNVFHIIESPTIEAFSQIGSIMLLFMIGVEFSITKLLSTGIRAIISSMLLIFLTFTIMHEVALLTGFDSITSLCIGSVFSISSTAIIMKILEQKKLIDRKEVPVLVAILIVEDIFAVFLLTFFSNLKSGLYVDENFLAAAIISLSILGFVYVILLRVLQKLSLILLRYQAEDTRILFSFALGIGLSVIASFLGLTPAIGAFLAGSIIAGLPNSRDFENSIRPFSHVFSSFFFLSVGMLINPVALLTSFDLTLILIGSFMAVVMLSTTLAFYLITTSGRSSVFAGLAMIPLGEFSLLIAKETIGLTEVNLVNIASLGVLITSIFCSFLVPRNEQAYLWFKSNLPSTLLSTLKDSSNYFINVISAFEPNGYFYNLLIKEVKNSLSDILLVLGLSLFYITVRSYLQFPVDLLDHTFSADMGLLAALVIIFSFPLIKLALSIKKLLGALSMIFTYTTPMTKKGSILRNILIGTVLLMLFANFYLVIEFLVLPRIFNLLSIIFGLLSIFFFWSAIRVSTIWLYISKMQPIDIMKKQILTSQDDPVSGYISPSAGLETQKKKKVSKKRKTPKNKNLR